MKTKKNKLYRFKKKTTRVTVDFPEIQHRKLKAIAALEGITMQDYILSLVNSELDETAISDQAFKPIAKRIIKQNRSALKRLANK